MPTVWWDLDRHSATMFCQERSRLHPDDSFPAVGKLVEQEVQAYILLQLQLRFGLVSDWLEIFVLVHCCVTPARTCKAPSKMWFAHY